MYYTDLEVKSSRRFWFHSENYNMKLKGIKKWLIGDIDFHTNLTSHNGIEVSKVISEL